jgi:phospholipid transport system substrate-binding protein
MNILRFALPLLAALALPLASAQELAPDVLVKSVTAEVIAAIRQDKGIQAGDARKIADLVEVKIVPHFDFRRATQIAMGANWRRATPEQQEQLTHEFRTLLVRTYSIALASYRDQVIETRPLRARPGDAEVTVRSRVRQAGAEPIVIEYDMEKTGSGWKVFDIRVAGISLVFTYRSTFAEEVRNHGIEGLISLLANKNRGAMRPVSVETRTPGRFSGVAPFARLKRLPGGTPFEACDGLNNPARKSIVTAIVPAAART